MLTYVIVFALLLVAELAYFKIADKFNIIDKPNQRSSHSTIVLRGGGIIFSLAMVVWAVMMAVQGDSQTVMSYLPFLAGLLMVAGVSFWDDVKSLPDSVRLIVQFVAMGFILQNINPIAANCTTKRTESGNDFTSSQKLTPATISKPAKNGK